MECRVKKDDENVSHFLKTVVLVDWWLIKAVDDGNKRLGVAGYTCKEQAVRAFSSAPIRRTYDVFTLETVDEITVLLRGFINKPRTEENGFPAEVFKHFVFGIPPYWENYVEKFLEEGFGGEDVSQSTKSPEKLVTDSGGPDDFHEGTPNRKRKAVGNSRTTKCDQKDLSEATKQSTNTTRKRIARSSSRLSDANQCPDDLCENSPKSNRKASAKSRLKTCDNLDSSQTGPDDFHGGTPIRKRKAISNSRATKCDQKDLSEATKQSTSTNTNTNTNRKRITRSSSKLVNANQCLDDLCENRPNSNRKATTKSRLKTCDNLDSSQDGKGSTGLDPNKKQKEKLVSKTRVANFNDKNSSQATKDVNNTKKVLGNCSRLKKKSTVEEEASSISKKKTKRKLAYEPNGASSISPQLSSLKKSRSGRKLLPMLEYWRNQTAVYDKEHELTGIKFRLDDLHC